MLRHLASKELKTLVRERIIFMMIILPLVIYPLMGGAMGTAIQQAVEVSRLRGIKIAMDGVDAKGCASAKAIAEYLRASGNISVSLYCGVDPVELVKRGYDVVIMVQGGLLEALLQGKPVNITVYIRGSLGGFTRTMTLPSIVPEVFRQAFSRGKRLAINTTALVVIEGRVWSFEKLQAIYSSAMSLLYGVMILGFFAASIAAVVIGAEREERMLETLLSMPIPHRDIVLSKMIAALVVACLASGSTMLGLYLMITGMGAPAGGVVGFRGYSIVDLLVYAGGVAATVFLIVSLAMLLSMFTSTIRGAQAVAGIAALPLLAVVLLPLVGFPGDPAYLAPYVGVVYAAFTPLVGVWRGAAAAAAQAAYALLATGILVKVLSSEVAITGPETLKRLLGRRMRRRLPG